jgi:predicted small metal-binding protein
MAKEYKQLACRDAGVECEFLVRAETADEVMEVVGGHAVRIHGYKDIPAEMAAQIRSLIKTVEV